jgi:hypothetical protein
MQQITKMAAMGRSCGTAMGMAVDFVDPIRPLMSVV